jgi:hypothetical protein
MVRRRGLGLLLALAALAAGLVQRAPVASAHGRAGAATGFVSTVAGTEPPLPGLEVHVLGGDDRLVLRNLSGKTIVILGYRGEPYLSFRPTGVYGNVRSPSTYLDRERNPARARVPASADPSARPLWRKVNSGDNYAWHDHRIHWIRRELPPGVRQSPNEIQHVFNWRVPARADGTPFAITGFLGYAPPPAAAGADGRGWIVPAALAGGGLVVALAIASEARRARRRGR